MKFEELCDARYSLRKFDSRPVEAEKLQKVLEIAWKREEDGKNHGEIDVTLAVSQMMLQAAELGLGTTYVGMFNPEKLLEQFPEMKGLQPTAYLPLGYPAETAHPSRLHADRKPLEELAVFL